MFSCLYNTTFLPNYQSFLFNLLHYFFVFFLAFLSQLSYYYLIETKDGKGNNMSCFNVDSNSFGQKCVSFEGARHEDFCFDYWNLTSDGDGVIVYFYIREEQISVTIKFNSNEDTYRIRVEDYL